MRVRSVLHGGRCRGLLAVVMSLTMVAAACGGDDASDDDLGGDATTTVADAPDDTGSDPSAPAGSATSDAPVGSPPGGDPVRGGEAEVLLYSEIGSLDPVSFTGSSGAEGQRAFALYGALVALDPATQEVAPILAESLTPNDDFTMWTLKLKPDIVFSDGAAFDAEAVKAHWERIRDPANRAPTYSYMTPVGELRVVDPLTLEIPLSTPNAHFPNSVSRGGLNYIGSPQAVADGVDMTSEAVGAGPFLLESWTRDDRMVMTANPDWKGSDGPYLERLTFRVVGDEEQRIDTFLTGDSDAYFTQTPSSVIRGLDGVDGAYHAHVQVTNQQSYVFNTSQPPFDDARVRRLFAVGVDWDGLAAAVFGEGAEVPRNMTVEGTPMYDADAALPAYAPDEAQSLIDGYVADNGGPLQIEMQGFQQSLDQARGEYIQTALSQYDDIEVTLQINDSPTSIGNVLAGEYQVSSWGFPVVAPDPGWYNSAYSESLTNYSRYSNPDVDAALLEMRATDDPAVVDDAMHRVVTHLAEDIPYYPYLVTSAGFVVSPDLHDAQVFGDGNLRVDLVWKQG